MNKKRGELLYIIFIVGFGAVLRIHTIGDRSLWMDELRQVSSYYVDSLPQFFLYAAYQFQTPLDNLIGYSLLHFFNFSEMVVRFPAFIFGVLTIIATFYLARHLFSTKVAIFASIFTSLSRFLVEYSQEARPYSMFFFFMLLTILLYFKATADGKRRYWVYFGLALYVMLLTRGFEPLVVLFSINILIITAFLLNLMLARKERVFVKKELIPTISVSFLVLIIYSPFFYVILKSSRYSVPTLSHFSLSSSLNTLLHFPIERIFEHVIALTQPLSLFFLIFSILGIMSITTCQERFKPLPLFFLLLVFLIPVIQVFIQHEKQLPVFLRYYIYLLPFLYIITSVGIVKSAEFVASRFSPLRKNALVIMVFISIPVIVVQGFDLSTYYKSDKKTDWKRTSQYLMNRLTKDDIILAESLVGYGDWNPGFYGKWLYFQGSNKVLDIYGLTNEVLINPESKGDIVLLLMNYPWGSRPSIESEKVEIKRFTNLNVIRLKDSGESLLENLLEMLSEMLKFMPNDSSAVNLYINKSRLLYFTKHKEEARIELDKARRLVPKHRMSLYTREIRLFEEMLNRE